MMELRNSFVKFATVGILYFILGYLLSQLSCAEEFITNVCEYPATECTENIKPGTLKTLVAEPESGWYFAGWLGELCSGTNPSCTFVMPKKYVKVMAIFDLLPEYTLFIETYGFEGGVVTSSPPGINCQSNQQCEAKFKSGQKVILTAVPPAGKYITWKGFSGCSGQGPCTINMTTSKAGNVKFR